MFYQGFGDGSREIPAIPVYASSRSGAAPHVVVVCCRAPAFDERADARFVPGGGAAVFKSEFHVGGGFGVRPVPAGVLAVVRPGSDAFHFRAIYEKVVVRNGAHGAGRADFSGLVYRDDAAQHPAIGAGAGRAEINGDGPGAFGLCERNGGATAAAALLHGEVGIEVDLFGVVFVGGEVFGRGHERVVGIGFFQIQTQRCLRTGR